MPTAKYEFKRDENSIKAFLRGNHASNDSLTALGMWSHQVAGRQFLVLTETDDVLVARLNWTENDSAAGAQLSGTCYELGIRWTVVSEAADAPGS